MMNWTLIEWLQAGQTPITLGILIVIWRIERRVFIMELELFPHKRIKKEPPK